MSVYAKMPHRFLDRLHFAEAANPTETLCCAGFEFSAWRCNAFAKHLIEWLPDYALTEQELNLHHGDAYDKLCEAAVRVYKSKKYERRGEAGEIALHAVCRDYFGTVPISPRVFYQSASNDVIKAFDMVHAKLDGPEIEIWLGESKLYADRVRAIGDAITSIRTHVEQGFLANEKLLLGPQIPRSTPRYEEVRELFRSQTSLDKLLGSAVFAIGILADSGVVQNAATTDATYKAAAGIEFSDVLRRLTKSGLCADLKIALIYIPISKKADLSAAFDQRLKGLTGS